MPRSKYASDLLRRGFRRMYPMTRKEALALAPRASREEIAARKHQPVIAQARPGSFENSISFPDPPFFMRMKGSTYMSDENRHGWLCRSGEVDLSDLDITEFNWHGASRAPA